MTRKEQQHLLKQRERERERTRRFVVLLLSGEYNSAQQKLLLYSTTNGGSFEMSNVPQEFFCLCNETIYAQRTLFTLK